MRTPEIKTIPPIHLIGMHTSHTLAASKAHALWSAFMPRRHEISHTIGTDFYCVQQYEKNQEMKNFTPHTVFKTYATVAVTGFEKIPEGMESLTLEGGLYAVFIHKGATADFSRTARYIFETWIPASKYRLDDRAHFEVLGKKYLGPQHPDSEEEVWIPILIK